MNRIRLFDKVKVINQHTAKWWKNNEVLSGDYSIEENEIRGNALIYDEVLITDNAHVKGDVKIYDFAVVCDNAIVCGKSLVHTNINICNDTKICNTDAHIDKLADRKRNKINNRKLRNKNYVTSKNKKP